MGLFFKRFWASFWGVIVASIVISVVGVVVVIAALALMSSTEVNKAVVERSILKIDLSEMIVDRGVESPLGDVNFGAVKMTSSLSLIDVVNVIDRASEDSRVEGIYIEVPAYVPIEITALEDVREAMLRFKESGKFIVSYSEVYPQNGYYLASVADSILVNPQGGVSWHGMAANVTFFKGLLDKLEVKTQVVRHGEFKSAVEPYTLTQMSAESRSQYQNLLDDMWGVIVGDVSRSTGIDSTLLVGYATDLRGEFPKMALEAGMVTALKYQDQVEGLLEQMVTEEGEPNVISVRDYLFDMKSKSVNSSENRVAVIYAEGAIMDGETGSDEIGSAGLSRQLADMREDQDIKAVVLRVNSPGGSALASEVIWREMELLRAEKPLIVSMGSCAASGGYYISCPADIILAHRLTLTGSIGVFGLAFDAQRGFKDKLGVTFDVVKTNPSADMGGVHRALTSTELSIMQRQVEGVYSTFVSRVSEGRNLSWSEVDRIGEGRVWSGVAALENGLIDRYGGLREATTLAADRAGVGTDYRVVVPSEDKGAMDMIIDAITGGVAVEALSSEIYESYRSVERVMRFSGVQMLMPFTVNID